MLAQHTDEVLVEIGLTRARIDELKRAKIIA